MTEKQEEVLIIAGGVIGIILVLLSAFEVIPKLDHIFAFSGVIFFAFVLVLYKLTK